MSRRRVAAVDLDEVDRADLPPASPIALGDQAEHARAGASISTRMVSEYCADGVAPMARSIGLKPMTAWTAQDIPDQSGRTVVVTGANSGIGLAAARELTRAGAHVVLAVRDTDKGRVAAAGMTGSTEVRALDLADLGSVRAFAAELRRADRRADQQRRGHGAAASGAPRTASRCSSAPTISGTSRSPGLLLDRIGDRVVTLSSQMHRVGKINFDDLQSERRYSRWPAYGQSKLANLIFAFELDRRLRAAGSERALARRPPRLRLDEPPDRRTGDVRARRSACS